MFSKAQKKEIVKNTIYIAFILLLAVISTYWIYNSFQDDRSIDFNSESLDVTYRESTGDKISLTKIIPVTDSVGLSSPAYLITIKNNLTEKVNYKIKVVDDPEWMIEEEVENQIPREDIRISVKAGKFSNTIYNLNELEDGILLEDTMDALEKKTISIHVWIRQDSTLPTNNNLYYHGIMQVIEEDRSLAINQ